MVRGRNNEEADQEKSTEIQWICRASDVAALRARVHQFNDMYREFARAAVRRERIARDLDAQGRTLTARDPYFFAAQLYALAQWPIFENTRENLALNERKNICYAKFMKSADHEIRRVEVPFAGKTLPGYLHLPPNSTGRVPCVWSISGLDSTKETGSPLNGDKLLERGIATLALEGPGQAECAIREIYLTQTNWQQAGPAVLRGCALRRKSIPTESVCAAEAWARAWHQTWQLSMTGSVSWSWLP